MIKDKKEQADEYAEVAMVGDIFPTKEQKKDYERQEEINILDDIAKEKWK